jgi:heterodisulfide reductase subunit D
VGTLTEYSSSIEQWLYNCIRCGNCKYVFKEYGPSCPSGQHFFFETYFASGRLWIAHGIEKGELDWNDSLLEPIFACTTCGSCEEQCLSPHAKGIIDVIEELRVLAVKNLGPLHAHKKFRDHIEAQHNPYGVDHHSRELVEKLGLPDKAPLVYFIGCTANYREKEIRDTTISLLQKAGIDFTIVDEQCCSSPLNRTGQIDLVHDLAEHNLNEFERAGAQQILTSCSGCYRTLTKDYPRLGKEIGLEVVHISQFLRDLLQEGRLSPNQLEDEMKITWHDPCHLGRACKEYDAPREVISHLGVELVEMENTRGNSWCCGAGGGARSAFPDWSLETSATRIVEAKKTGVSHLVSACPFCKRNLTDSSDDSLEILDLSELVDRLT